MAWLIESYLEEGKHGPDHPESLGMKNTKDFKNKQIKGLIDISKDNDKTLKRINKMDKESVYKRITVPEVLAQSDYDHKEQQLWKNAYNAAKRGEDDEAIKLSKKANEYGNKAAAIDNRISASIRHDKRHPDRAVKESVSNIVELLQ